MFESLGPSAGPLLIAIMMGLLAAHVFFIQTLNRTLTLTQAHHIASSGSAWALLIPFFNWFWIFYIITKVAQGVKGRYKELHMDCGDTGQNYGYLLGGLMLASFLPTPLGDIATVAAVGAWIGYWVKVAGYNKVLAEAAQQPEMRTMDESAGSSLLPDSINKL